MASPKKTLESPLSGVPWRHYKNPSAEELAALEKSDHFEHLDIEDCLHRREIAKVVQHDNYAFLVTKVLRYDAKTQHLVFDDFDMFVREDSLVTIEERPGTLIARVHDRFKARELQALTIPVLVHTILDEIIDEYLLTLDKIGENVSTFEGRILKDQSPKMIEDISRAKRALIEFRRNAGGMREVVSLIIRDTSLAKNRALEPAYRDLYEHSIRIIEFIETYRDVLNGFFDIYLSAIANRTNQVVKVLTIFGVVVLPLLIIPGLYGMNIALPLQDSPHAFAAIVSLIVASTAGILLLLRTQKWY